ncbi:hypothetical protein Ndes2526B_g05369 [Nannochloris sp. 'desiccata']|nr:hypothetical protein KSW81_006277 [Chlorella desiccata (nom. nud.)]
MKTLGIKVTASAVDQPKLPPTTSTHHSFKPRSVAPRQNPSSRRELLAAIALVPASFTLAPLAANAVPVPSPPTSGDCPDCIGEINNTLNACNLQSQSCISTLNDDEVHFAPPWQFDGPQADAINRLIEIATGGQFEPGLINEPFGVSRADAGMYIAKGVLTVLTNGDTMPARPQRRRQTEIVPFDGILAERRTTANGSEYVRITLGIQKGGEEVVEVDDPVTVIDAEFLFLKDDNIVNVRASSRAEPPNSGLQSGELALSFTSGLIVDRNVAKRKMDTLRTALRWDLAPVLTDFDPKFNPNAPVWLEKVFKPFDDRNNFKPSGIAYPVE